MPLHPLEPLLTESVREKVEMIKILSTFDDAIADGVGHHHHLYSLASIQVYPFEEDSIHALSKGIIPVNALVTLVRIRLKLQA